MRGLILACMLASSQLVACSSDVSTDEGSGGVSREQACDDISKAICDQYSKCLPLFVTMGFGDSATCVSRTKASCPTMFDASKTSATPARVSTCAAGLRQLSCEALSTTTPAACVPEPGGLDDGAPCSDDAQCRSTWCPKNETSFCGKCTKLPTAGAACVDLGTKADGEPQKECGRGLTCAKDVCVKPGETGAACDDSKPCALGLACFNGKCVAAGKPGSKCDPEGKVEPACDFAQGAFCNPATKVCQSVVAAKAGESCGIVGTDFKLCSAGGKCVTPAGAMSGTCVAPAVDGAACNTKDGPDCLAPAKCVGGVCKLPDPTACK